LTRPGFLIRGANNAGKTVYLRSLGTAQVLTQGGLPVLADSASVCIRSGVYTLFSTTEAAHETGNAAGRFEQEVRILAAFLDNIQPNSLILLNEIFQSTAYEEGAEGLYAILKTLNNIGCKWVLVTFLLDLFEWFKDDAVAKAEMEAGHKLCIK
jgi:DNA mismatch repair ATPase MutS